MELKQKNYCSVPVSDAINRLGRQALMLKPKSIQRATKIPINQCDRLRTLAFLSIVPFISIDALRNSNILRKIAKMLFRFKLHGCSLPEHLAL